MTRTIAYEKGYIAFRDGALLTSNPFKTNDPQSAAWEKGWIDAHKETFD